MSKLIILILVFPNALKKFTFLVSSSQEDDIEGIHIVAFAEEEDPGESILHNDGPLFYSSVNMRC